MKQFNVLAGGIVLGVAITAGWFTLGGGGDAGGEALGANNRGDSPLYWVAPMDSSYRRDAPGKSPMGMDLVPVYADDGDEKGQVRISPTVVNNLGVRVNSVERRILTESVRSVGYVRYDEEQLSHVHPRVSGWVERLYVHSAGEQVEAGAPLYTLYSPQLVSAQEELRIAVQRGQADLVAASRERLEALQIPTETIDRLRAGGKVGQTVTFRATQAGVVDNLNIREGFFVEPGTTLMSIGALDPIWVEVEVFERQASRIDVGLPVRMTLPYLPGREWRGEVDYIYPTVDANLRTLTLRLRFANPDRSLKPNMYAEVAIDTAPVELLAVPREAVIRIGNENRVVRQEAPGTYRSVPVQLGRIVGDYQEVLHGLAPGDRVVTSAQFLLDSESSKSAAMARMGGQDAMGDHPEHRMQSRDAMDDHSGHRMGPMDESAGRETLPAEGDQEHAGHNMTRGGQQHD